ncbi:hypothetical protein PNH50_08210 [Leisingera aquaemixtae]|jgi:hypothetical protein|uniref:Secreted protein n=1 Tax=Leisingera aquaemixtae TaxID=1396826 RepID=A0ABY5WNF5_9RHOB|nr:MULTISPECIES: hypothetical protein [Leisingera]QDI75897.1 hypothetical protein R2C4_09130 [Leisingera aquaemixtae]UWQ26424.1 hypothetical protein K3553_08145 [Leisingera aquaemixtae]UWQ38943.1 hypothetical protein K3552_08015 [Leisingera aquaemixtae]UWQ43051.1 hypothetical protein K3718_08175 [Leisingera aquaemixtae]UWQ47386.1 hypothetical protein K3719_08485 [Leisingera aquaemixtae]
MSLFASILVLGIVVMTAVVAVVSQRRRPLEDDDTDPDYHTLRSDYQSGMGGGSVRTWKVPKDPQEYARFFVPKSNRK